METIIINKPFYFLLEIYNYVEYANGIFIFRRGKSEKVDKDNPFCVKKQEDFLLCLL